MAETEYSIQVDLEGGSGKASVTSPTILSSMMYLSLLSLAHAKSS